MIKCPVTGASGTANYHDYLAVSNYIFLFAVYLIILVARVIVLRVKLRVSLGDGTRETFQEILTSDVLTKGSEPEEKKKILRDVLKKSQYTPLLEAIRAQGNFIELVPITLLAVAVAEISGAASKCTVHLLLLPYFLARILHVEFGLRANGNLGFGRTLGMMISLIVLLIAGSLLAEKTWGFVIRHVVSELMQGRLPTSSCLPWARCPWITGESTK